MQQAGLSENCSSYPSVTPLDFEYVFVQCYSVALLEFSSSLGFNTPIDQNLSSLNSYLGFHTILNEVGKF